MTLAPDAPGTLHQPIVHLPVARNPNFTGRVKLLSDLHRGLNARVLGSGPRVRVISGSGGMGKTHLAAEFAHRHADEYDLIWWVRAEEPATMAAGYAALADALHLRHEEAFTEETLTEDVRKELDRRSRWLLIFDNVRAPELVNRYLPKRGDGHVIITARSTQWPSHMTSFALQGLDRIESLDLLSRMTGRDAHIDDAASDLARALADLPLALEQAGACMREADMPFADYLQKLEGQWAEFLSKRRTHGEYPDSVALAGELSFRQVQAAAPYAADLLNLCAFLNPDEIAASLLRCGSVFVTEPLASTLDNPASLAAAGEMLARFNLARFDGANFSLHRLVRALARDRLEPEARKTWAKAALELAGSAFEFDSENNADWRPCAPVLPHVLAATAAADSLGVDKPVTARLLEDAALYLLRTGQYAQARPLLERALVLQRETVGDNHPHVAAVANNLGRVLTHLGELDEAKLHFESALTIDQAVYGIGDPHTASVANNYARCLHAAGEIGAAREQFELALGTYQNHYGSDHFKVAGVVNNLGYVLKEEGDVRKGLEHFQRALAIAEATCGRDDPSVARILCNLGEAHRREHNPGAALPLFERALRIDRAYYGTSHPDVMHDLRHLGDAHLSLGHLDAARDAYKQALFIADATCSHKPRVIAECLRRLGLVRSAQGDEAGAARCTELAESMLRKQRAKSQMSESKARSMRKD